MTELTIGIIVLVIAILVLIFKTKKKEEVNEDLKADDAPLPTPPTPPTGTP